MSAIWQPLARSTPCLAGGWSCSPFVDLFLKAPPRPCWPADRAGHLRRRAVRSCPSRWTSSGSAFDGVYVGGAWPLFFKRAVPRGGPLTALGSRDWLAERSRRQGEYYMLMLMSSVLGMTLLPGARDWVLLLVAFELMGMPLYVLAAWAKTEDRRARSRS
jgi:hypothetical protein